MEIEYKGANGLMFKVGSVSLVIDPKLSTIGQKDLKVDGAIELVTSLDFAVTEGGQKILIEGPGEYEISGVSVKGVAATSHNHSEGNTTIYRLDIAGFRIAILGHIEVPLSEAQLEVLGVVDIVTVPVGGNGYTLDAHEAATIVRQIDPKIVIPTHYNDSALKYEVPQDSLEGFLKELGATQHETTDKFKIKSGTPVPAILTVFEIKRT